MTTDKTIGEDTNTTHQYRVSAGVETYIITAVDAYAAERIAKSNYIKTFGIAPQRVTARMVTTSPDPLADLWKDTADDDTPPEHPAFYNPDAEALAVALEYISDHQYSFRYTPIYIINDMRQNARKALASYRAKHPKDTR